MCCLFMFVFNLLIVLLCLKSEGIVLYIPYETMFSKEKWLFNFFKEQLTVYIYFQAQSQLQLCWTEISCIFGFPLKTETWNLSLICLPSLCKFALKWKTTSQKENLTERQPRRKTTSQKENLTEGQPHRKTTSKKESLRERHPYKYNLTERQPHRKTTSQKENLTEG